MRHLPRLAILSVLFAALPGLAQVESPARLQARVDLNVWKSVLESYFVDHNGYPQRQPSRALPRLSCPKDIGISL